MTSKLAIISPSEDKDVDIEYKSGALGPNEPFVDHSVHCEKMSSGVGLSLGEIRVTIIDAENPVAPFQPRIWVFFHLGQPIQ